MPLVKQRSRGDNVKVFRPVGSRYSEGRHGILMQAISKAQVNFMHEFGEMPKQEDTIYEIIGATADWVVNLFEIKDNT